MNNNKSPQNIIKKQQRSTSSRLSVNVKPEIPKQGILKHSKTNSHTNSLVNLLYGDLNNPKYGDLSDIQLLKSLQTKNNQFQSQYLSNSTNTNVGPNSKEFRSSQTSYFQYKDELKQYEMTRNFLKQELNLNEKLIQRSQNNSQETKILIKDQQIKTLMERIDSESKSPSPVRQITSNFSDIYQLRSDINKKNEVILELQLKIDRDKLNFYTKFQQLEEEWRFKYNQMEQNLQPSHVQKKIENYKLQIKEYQEDIQNLQDQLEKASLYDKKDDDKYTFEQLNQHIDQQRQEIKQYKQQIDQLKQQIQSQENMIQSKINELEQQESIQNQRQQNKTNQEQNMHQDEINKINQDKYHILQKYLMLCVNFEFQALKQNQNETENQQTIFQLQQQLQESHEQFQIHCQKQDKDLLIKQEQTYNASMQIQIQLNDNQSKKIIQLNEEIQLLSQNLEIMQQKYLKEHNNQKQTLKELDLCLIELDKQKQENEDKLRELQQIISQKDQHMIDSIQNLGNEMDLLVEERLKEKDLLKNLKQQLNQNQIDYQEEIEEKNHKIIKLENSIKQLHQIQQEDLKNLEDKYESKFDKMNDDKDYIKQLQSDKKILQKSKQELQDQVSVFQEKCTQVEKQLEKKNTFQDKMIEQLKGQIVELQKVGQDAQTDYEIFQKKQIEKETSYKKEYQSSMQILEENLQDQIERVKQLEEEKINIQKQIQYVVKTQLEKELVQLNDIHEEEKNQLKEQIQNLDNYAQKQIFENNQVRNENKLHKNDVQQLQQTLNEQIKFNDNSQEQMTQQYKQLQQDSKEQAKNIQKYIGIINLQENQIKELNDKIQLDKEQHQNKMIAYKKDVEHQVEQQVNEELQKLLQKFQNEQQQSEKKLQSVIFENKKLILEIQNYQEQLRNEQQTAHKQLSNIQQENAQYKSQLQFDLVEQKSIMEQQIIEIVNHKLIELTNKNKEEKARMQCQILELCDQLQESNNQNVILFNTIKEFQQSQNISEKVQFAFDEINADHEYEKKENQSPLKDSKNCNISRSKIESK